MSTERQIGCRDHEGAPLLHCRRCRSDSFGWLRAAFEITRADAATARAERTPHPNHAPGGNS